MCLWGEAAFLEAMQKPASPDYKDCTRQPSVPPLSPHHGTRTGCSAQHVMAVVGTREAALTKHSRANFSSAESERPGCSEEGGTVHGFKVVTQSHQYPGRAVPLHRLSSGNSLRAYLEVPGAQPPPAAGPWPGDTRYSTGFERFEAHFHHTGTFCSMFMLCLGPPLLWCHLYYGAARSLPSSTVSPHWERRIWCYKNKGLADRSAGSLLSLGARLTGAPSEGVAHP